MLPPPRLLAIARMLAGMSQRELAIEAKLAASAIGRYETGIRGLSGTSFERILAVLRNRGIRFLGETDEIAVGLMLLKGEAAEKLLAVKAPSRAARGHRRPPPPPPRR